MRRILCHFTGLLLILFGGVAQSSTNRWEVGVLFFTADENEAYQIDVDENIRELGAAQPSDVFRMGIFRAFKDHNIAYVPNARAQKGIKWDPLFFRPLAEGRMVPETLRLEKREPGHAFHSKFVKEFLSGLFQDPKARRVLVIYSHGNGPYGLRGISSTNLRETIESLLPKRSGTPLDILWLSSCFMGNVESFWEWRELTSFLIGSQDAEFSAGPPFELLQPSLVNSDDIYTALNRLGESYVESYSYTKGGSQSEKVKSSSATITIVETQRLNPSPTRITLAATELMAWSQHQRDRMGRLSDRIRMERRELVDYGLFLRELRRSQFLGPEARGAVLAELEALELMKAKRIRTAPRVLVRPPSSESFLVFGYNHWRLGFESDVTTLEKLPPGFRPDTFFEGPDRKRWPAMKMKRAHFLSPFSAGLNEFNFYFTDVNGKPITPLQRARRTDDFVHFHSSLDSNPIVFSGYTQGIGSQAEKYTGLNIRDPFHEIENVFYVDLNFFELTHWGRRIP